jgi:hypothetical protein
MKREKNKMRMFGKRNKDDVRNWTTLIEAKKRES